MTWTTNDHLPTTTKEFAEYLRDLAAKIDRIPDMPENAYRRAHVRSIEASTAAMISWLMMAPAIVEVADATVIQRWVGSARATVVAYRHESGNFTGIPIPAEVGAAVWKRGARPNLVPKPT